MSQRFSTPIRLSDPTALAGTRMPGDLEVSPARNTFNRNYVSGASPIRPTSQQSMGGGGGGFSPGWVTVSPSRNGGQILSPQKSYVRGAESHEGGEGNTSYADSECQVESKPRREILSRLVTEFREVTEIGNGNFGHVMKGVHELDGCTYAIKKNNKPIQGDADLQHRLQEVYALSGCSAKASSPYILRYYDAWIEEDGCVCIRTEYLDGGNLHDACVKHPERSPLMLNPLNPSLLDPCKVWEFLFQMSLALNSIHASYMAHLDVKPDNIFFSVNNHAAAQDVITTPTVSSPNHPLKGTSTTNNNGLPLLSVSNGMVSYKLGDFGLARPLTDKTLEQYKGLNDDEGDKRYLCPYLLSRSKGPLRLKEADVFSLGATALEIMGCCSATKGEEEIRHSILAKFSLSTQHAMSTSPNMDTATLRFHSGVTLADTVTAMVRTDPVLRPSTLSIAMVCYEAMQKLRSADGRYVPLDEPAEVKRVRELQRLISEAEERLRSLQPAKEELDGSQGCA